jgi:hypothetical protein
MHERLHITRWMIVVAALTACDGGGAAIDAAAPSDAPIADGADARGDTGACPTPDADGDGARSIACGGDDCDDSDPERFPGNTEVCDAADHDEDCDALTFGDRDGDGDGQADATCCNEEAGTRHCGNDCDDTRVGVHVDAPEVCNAIDDDCDTAVDEGVGIVFYEDCDGDGVGASVPMTLCTPSTCGIHAAVTSTGDCDDAHPMVRPGASGLCDCTPAHAYDADGDGHVTLACGGDDCEDAFAMIAPGAAGACDCTAARDYDADDDGHFTTACGGDDCDDASASFHPGALGSCGVCPGPLVRAAELCDGLDDDCDGAVDEVSASASCPLPHGTPTCTAAACAVASCDAGFHECTGACVASDDLATCGARCTPCPPPPARAIASCDGSSCGFVCDAGYAAAGTVCDIAPPRAIAPLSTSFVTSRRPTLRWALEPATDGARVEVCRDRACATILATIDSTGTSAAPPTDLPTGVVFWRLRSRVGATLSAATSPIWQFTVGARTAPVDASWGTTLDVNGDGYADIAVGAPDPNGSAGHAYVYLGGASGASTTPASTLNGPSDPSGVFGGTVASAGDVNGDGYADLIVGAVGVESYRGAAYVYLGGGSGLALTPRATLLGPDAGRFGVVSSAGDVNGDGYADVVVGAPNAAGTGRAYLYLGSPTGLGSAPATTLLGPAGLDGFFGLSVAGAGDVNGDGFADVIAGSIGAASGVGSAYLYLGSSTGLATAPATTLPGLDGANGYFGRSVACAGDVDGDGYADVVVGSQSGATANGHAYVYLGSASGLASAPVATLGGPGGGDHFGGSVAGAGDANGDGYADIVVGARSVSSDTGNAYVFLGGPSGLATLAATTLIGPDGPGSSFGGSVASAGDANGDGYADVVVGAYATSSRAGRAHVFPGAASGTGTVAATTLLGAVADDSFGFSVASAADVLERCDSVEL